LNEFDRGMRGKEGGAAGKGNAPFLLYEYHSVEDQLLMHVRSFPDVFHPLVSLSLIFLTWGGKGTSQKKLAM
jgi:hypothetical protein